MGQLPGQDSNLRSRGLSVAARATVQLLVAGSAKPANIERSRVVVVVGLRFTSTASFARTPYQFAASDCMPHRGPRLLLCTVRGIERIPAPHVFALVRPFVFNIHAHCCSNPHQNHRPRVERGKGYQRPAEPPLHFNLNSAFHRERPRWSRFSPQSVERESNPPASPLPPTAAPCPRRTGGGI